jgi:hypothetical protein
MHRTNELLIKQNTISDIKATIHITSSEMCGHVILKKGRARFKRDGTSAETRFRLSEKRTSPFESAGVSI